MPNRERERLARLEYEAWDLLAAVDEREWLTVRGETLIPRLQERYNRRRRSLRNLDALSALEAETPEDIMREAYP
jgi:hypothetical protein